MVFGNVDMFTTIPVTTQVHKLLYIQVLTLFFYSHKAKLSALFSYWFSTSGHLSNMLLSDFYRDCFHPMGAYEILRSNGLLPSLEDVPPCERCGHTNFAVRLRREKPTAPYRPSYRCLTSGCRTWKSIRVGNRFFYYTNANGHVQSRLPLQSILELVLMFIIDLPYKWVSRLTGRAQGTISDWFNMCREVCTGIVEGRPQMVGTRDNPIQIDESRFAGKRKYNRGRLLQGDRRPRQRDPSVAVINNRNHGNRVDGPWVFGLIQGNDCRYFWVQRRDRATLLPIIQRECAPGSHITSDEWKAYANLGQKGFVHKKVCHQENYVNPRNGAHTQTIERSWLDAKVRMLKRQRGVPARHLQGHLDYYCWMMLRKNEACLFTAFLKDIATVYT